MRDYTTDDIARWCRIPKKLLRDIRKDLRSMDNESDRPATLATPPPPRRAEVGDTVRWRNGSGWVSGVVTCVTTRQGIDWAGRDLTIKNGGMAVERADCTVEVVGRTKSLATMAAEVRKVNTDKGWRDDIRTFAEYIALAHSELSEALDTFREIKLAERTNVGKPDDVASEFADVLIRLLDMCDIYSIDLEAEYERKMAYNRTRPRKHGGKVL